MFDSVLVANRGEIAVRVIRTLQRLGIKAIAVYSDADADAPHVRLADAAVRLGPAPSAQSYLNIERVLAAAASSGAQAIHPGYGFLSENPAFVRACADAGVVFIGPPAEAMEALGDKVQAKLIAERVGVPVVPGLQRPGLTDEEIIAFAKEVGRFPLLIKAAAGGGGRGMRVVNTFEELEPALGAARREALAGFSDDTVFVERYVERARHIEVQLLADGHGNVVHLGERECSLQRRHQKVVEESPSPVVSEELRARIGEAACELARSAGYRGAGTCEFLADFADPTEFYFLEINARLQVEHPVTEYVTGLDLVEQQLLVAAGEPLSFTQSDIALKGHAIEVRVTAEDAAGGFLPATGKIIGYREPAAPGVRVDSGVRLGSEISSHYDSLIAKVIGTGANREEAIERVVGALRDLRILGVTTNAGFLARLVASEPMRSGAIDTRLIERGEVDLLPGQEERDAALIAAAAIETLTLHDAAVTGDPWDVLVGFRLDGQAAVEWEFRPLSGGDTETVRVVGPPSAATVEIGAQAKPLRVARAGEAYQVSVDGTSEVWDHAALGDERWVAHGADAWSFRRVEPVVEGAESGAGGALEAPMPGTVLKVEVSPGAEVAEGDVLVVIESMKMELSLVAPADGVVAEVHVGTGDGVRQGQPLVALEARS